MQFKFRSLCVFILVAVSAIFLGAFTIAAQNTSISYGQTISGTINSDSPFIYSFRGTRGDVISITMIATSGGLDPFLAIYGRASLTPLAENDDSGVSTNAAIINYTLPATRTYIIEAGRKPGTTATGNFDLQLTLISTRATVTPTATPAVAAGSGQFCRDTYSVPNYARSAVSSLRVRSGPATTFGRIGAITPAQSYQVLGFTNGWYCINFNGQEGFVSERFVFIATQP